MYNQSSICHCSNCKQHGTLKCFQKHGQPADWFQTIETVQQPSPTQPDEQPSAQHKNPTNRGNCLPVGWVGKPAETAWTREWIGLHISILPIPIRLPESMLHRYLYAHQPQQHDLLISFWNLMLLFSLTWLASHQSSVSLIPDYENAPVKWFSSSPWLNRYTQLAFLIFSCLYGYLFMV